MLRKGLGREIVCKWICLKISQMVESDIQWFAGGWQPLGKKRSQEQCQGHQGNSFISQLTGAKFSKISQAYSQAVSHR